MSRSRWDPQVGSAELSRLESADSAARPRAPPPSCAIRLGVGSSSSPPVPESNADAGIAAIEAEPNSAHACLRAETEGAIGSENVRDRVPRPVPFDGSAQSRTWRGADVEPATTARPGRRLYSIYAPRDYVPKLPLSRSLARDNSNRATPEPANSATVTALTGEEDRGNVVCRETHEPPTSMMTGSSPSLAHRHVSPLQIREQSITDLKSKILRLLGENAERPEPARRLSSSTSSSSSSSSTILTSPTSSPTRLVQRPSKLRSAAHWDDAGDPGAQSGNDLEPDVEARLAASSLSSSLPLAAVVGEHGRARGSTRRFPASSGLGSPDLLTTTTFASSSSSSWQHRQVRAIVTARTGDLDEVVKPRAGLVSAAGGAAGGGGVGDAPPATASTIAAVVRDAMGASASESESRAAAADAGAMSDRVERVLRDAIDEIERLEHEIQALRIRLGEAERELESTRTRRNEAREPAPVEDENAREMSEYDEIQVVNKSGPPTTTSTTTTTNVRFRSRDELLVLSTSPLVKQCTEAYGPGSLPSQIDARTSFATARDRSLAPHLEPQDRPSPGFTVSSSSPPTYRHPAAPAAARRVGLSNRDEIVEGYAYMNEKLRRELAEAENTILDLMHELERSDHDDEDADETLVTVVGSDDAADNQGTKADETEK